MKKYRAELNKYNRDKGTYGNGDGKGASHKNGKISGFEDESTNKGRREKSRLKKEVNEENIKVQVDRGSVNLPKDRKVLQTFGKIWKAVYGGTKNSPDQVGKYKSMIKKISDTTTSSIDKLAGVFTFMGKQFNVEVEKNKFSEHAPTPWRIAFLGNVVENIEESKMDTKTFWKGLKLSEAELMILTTVFDRYSGGGPVADKKTYVYIKPDYASKIIGKALTGSSLTSKGKTTAQSVKKKIDDKLKLGELKEIIREIVVKEYQKLNEKNVNDEEFVVDQLTNAWEFMSPQEMYKHLAKQTKADKIQLKKLVNDYYKNDARRNSMRTNVLNWVEEYI